jgi:hypothetical protein
MQPQTIEKLWVGPGDDKEVRKLLILFDLQSWLAALDDFRNWLIREAA